MLRVGGSNDNVFLGGHDVRDAVPEHTLRPDTDGARLVPLGEPLRARVNDFSDQFWIGETRLRSPLRLWVCVGVWAQSKGAPVMMCFLAVIMYDTRFRSTP